MLAQQGYTTYATMRNLSKQDALLKLAKEAGVKIKLKALDVQDSASVQNCVNEILRHRLAQRGAPVQLLYIAAKSVCIRLPAYRRCYAVG